VVASAAVHSGSCSASLSSAAGSAAGAGASSAGATGAGARAAATLLRVGSGSLVAARNICLALSFSGPGSAISHNALHSTMICLRFSISLFRAKRVAHVESRVAHGGHGGHVIDARSLLVLDDASRWMALARCWARLLPDWFGVTKSRESEVDLVEEREASYHVLRAKLVENTRRSGPRAILTRLF
jgi:hypothetical protein